MKIGIAFVKKDKKTNKLVFSIHYDKKIKPIKTKERDFLIDLSTLHSKNDEG